MTDGDKELREKFRDIIGFESPELIESVNIIGLNLPASRFEEILDKLLSVVHAFCEQREFENSATSEMLYTRQGVEERERLAKISGMEQAKSRVLRRTEIPKDAKNPTRDIVVVIGEECARIIDDDIAALQSHQPGGEADSHNSPIQGLGDDNGIGTAMQLGQNPGSPTRLPDRPEEWQK